MAVQRIYFDKAEISLTFKAGNRYPTVLLTGSQIQRIQFDKIKEFSLFRFVDSEKITITNSKTGEPIVYTKKKEKAFYDEYKQGLKEFAKTNNVTLQDNTEN